MVYDLNDLIEVLVDTFPAFRFNLFQWQNNVPGHPERWSADIQNVWGKGPTPLTAVLNLYENLGLKLEYGPLEEESN